MHMADALLAPAVAATMYAASAVTVGASVKTLKKDEATAKLPTMAVTSALVFAGQMINYTIPGTGSSGHLCGGMLLSALLGPRRVSCLWWSFSPFNVFSLRTAVC